MREIGTVKEINGDRAVVSVDKKDECERCGLCLFKNGEASAEFFVKTDALVKVGDKVEIERSENGKFLGATLAFSVPLLLIGLAVLIDYLFIKKEIFILVLSVLFIAVWYGILAAADKAFKKSGAFSAKIISVLSADETQNETKVKDTKE